MHRLVEELAVSLILLCYGRIYTLVTDLGRAVSGRPLYLVYVRCEVQPPRDAEGCVGCHNQTKHDALQATTTFSDEEDSNPSLEHFISFRRHVTRKVACRRTQETLT